MKTKPAPDRLPVPSAASKLARPSNKQQDLVEVRAGEAAGKIIAAGPAAKIAKRIKDVSALEKALLIQLESERDFAREYKNKFPERAPERAGPGRGHKKAVDTSVNGFPDHKEFEKWCLSFGFQYRTVARWFELLLPEKFTGKKDEILKRCWELAALWQAANFSSESIEWYTPPEYIEAVREALGEIDLDPASSQHANFTVGAKNIYTKDDDGLDKQWSGRVFMNPPYGKTENGESLAATFCNKAIQEYEAGNIDACITLINSLHSQSWQAPLYKYPICLVNHRIEFVSGDGDANKNPTFQNMFVYMGTDLGRFYEAFRKFGYVMKEFGS